MYMTAKECADAADQALKVGDHDHAEWLIRRANAIKAGPDALRKFDMQGIVAVRAPEFIKQIQATRQHDARIDQAMDAAIKAEALAEIDPAAAKLADELHGGNYAQRSHEKARAYVSYLKGAPVSELGGADRTVVLSPAQLLEAVRMGWSAAEIKATLITSQDSLGGFLVSGTVSDQVLGRAAALSVVRQRATVDTPGAAGSIGFPIFLGSGDVYPSELRGQWTSEIGTLTEENPLVGMVKPPINLWRCKVRVTKSLLEDAGARLINGLNKLFAETIRVEEDKQELVGDGSGAPLGILAQQVAGTLVNKDIRVVNSGNPTAIMADGVINMIYSLPAQYRNAPGFAVTCKAATVKALRLLQDQTGRYLFDERDHTLCGYTLAESESMPTIAANAFPLACGDFSGYAIADKVGLSIERFDDSATADVDSVIIYVRRRLGGTPAAGYRFAALKVSA